ncbi:MAG: hypothetical protein MJ146_00080 [Clostridia bacterium]|nr:hypothetical protein [Clostridia bacterium]
MSLLKVIGIDEYSEFEYFEDFQNLIESDEEISADEIYMLLKNIDLKNFADIVRNYFDDISNHIPGESVDLYTLLSNIGNSMIGMALNCDEDSTYLLLADEIAKFRKYYLDSESSYCISLEDGSKEYINLRDALVNARGEALGGEKYEYYFDNFLSYPLEDYVMSFKDLIDIENYSEKTLDMEGDFLYDDEFKDEE